MVRVRSFDAVQAENRIEALRFLQSQPRPEVKNVAAALAVEGPLTIVYHERAYTVWVTWQDGVQLQRIMREWDELNDHRPAAPEGAPEGARGLLREPDLAKLEALLRQTVRICGRIMRPVGWRRALPWRRSPAADASDVELRHLILIFWSARTRSRVRSFGPPPR